MQKLKTTKVLTKVMGFSVWGAPQTPCCGLLLKPAPAMLLLFLLHCAISGYNTLTFKAGWVVINSKNSYKPSYSIHYQKSFTY